jgi:uncharacterized membrane protein YoaK (UPF0700 family)
MYNFVINIAKQQLKQITVLLRRMTMFLFAQNVAQLIFIKINAYRGKSSPKIVCTSAIFQKLTKVNNRPIGEKSPNLVIMLLSYFL